MTLSIADAAQLWSPAGVYLNTASYGLPPRPAWDALQAALEEWREGRTSWEHWGESTEGARAAFARLTGFGEDEVAVGANVSALVGFAAEALAPGACVVAPQDDFVSLLFPFLAQEDRGVEVRLVPLESLADAVDERTTIVAFSAVQSADGRVADLARIAAAARAHGALSLCDATQACGWLPLDGAGLDVVVCGAYKWLMAPRGTAFLAARRERLAQLRPLAAGWYGAEHPLETYYGPPLRQAASARRFDVSPAWHPWVGTRPALELIETLGVEQIRAHDVGLANRFRAGAGLQPSDSAIVSLDLPGAAERLAGSNIQAAVRAGGLRVSFHLYNTEADVDAVLERLGLGSGR